MNRAHSGLAASILDGAAPASSEIVEGYLDGLRSELPELGPSNRSELYMHGWRNGRDDRRQEPRASAEAIRDSLRAIKDTTHDR